MRNGCSWHQILIFCIQLQAKHSSSSSHPFQQSYPPNSICKDHVALVEVEISSLKEKEVIVQCHHELGEFISPIFSVPKKDGNVRLIHNLRKLNCFVENSHFKMDSIHTVFETCHTKLLDGLFGLKRCILLCWDPFWFPKMFKILLQGHPIQVHSLPKWFVHLPKNVH